jgi:hypothetical protein
MPDYRDLGDAGLIGMPADQRPETAPHCGR